MANDRRESHSYNLAEVLAAIVEYKRLYDGNSPPYRWLMQRLDISSTSVVHNLLERLEADGLIQLMSTGGKYRTQILVTDGRWIWRSGVKVIRRKSGVDHGKK